MMAGALVVGSRVRSRRAVFDRELIQRGTIAGVLSLIAYGIVLYDGPRRAVRWPSWRPRVYVVRRASCLPRPSARSCSTSGCRAGGFWRAPWSLRARRRWRSGDARRPPTFRPRLRFSLGRLEFIKKIHLRLAVHVCGWPDEVS